MKNLTQLLIGLLVIQIALVGYAFMQKPALEGFTPEESLLNLSSLDLLSEIKVIPSSNEEAQDAAHLKKTDGKWILANHFDFPVSEQKLKLIEEELFKVKKPYPSGTTPLAAKQFFTAEDNYKMKLEFISSAEKVIETLYFGSSPTFKKVYARTADNDLTYSVPFSVFSLKGKPSSWINRDYLKVNSDQIKQVNFADFSFTVQKDTPKLIDVTEEEAVDQSALIDLFKASLAPSFLEVLGLELKEEYDQEAPVFSYTIEFNNDSKRTYTIGKLKGEDNYFTLKASDLPYFFKASSFQTEKLTKATRATLVKAKEVSTDEVNAEN